MKRFVLLAFVFAGTISNAQQQEHFCAKTKQASMQRQFNAQARQSSVTSLQISHETKYDVKFVHLDLNVERTNTNISGNVKTIATVTASVLDTFQTLLHQNYIIDSVYFNGALFSTFRQDSIIKGGLATPLPIGATFTSIVYYHGTAPTGGSAIGDGLSSANSWYGNTNRATWSLSESFVAYHWWACKQYLTDKIDSSWVFITTDSTNMAGSNGVLTNVVTTGSKKRYEWKSRSPIDYYLISIAVSKFKEYNLYAHPQYLPNDSILIQNYIDVDAWTNIGWNNSQKPELNQMPATMEFLCDMYGMYPFYKEKYGHCLVRLGGGMEHQTMTTIGFFDMIVNAHELGHQWWGDNVTCASWKDIWINEGFASYTEHLTAQYLLPSQFMPNLNYVHNDVMSLAGGSIFFTGADTMNTNRIFNSRLTYNKGGAIVRTLQFLTNNDSLWFNTLRGFQNTYKNSTASVIDFKNYYHTHTGIDPTQFFNQWYYGEGYPLFTVRYNFNGDTCFIKSTQSVSMPSVTPLFITPMEYKISRTGKPDTIVRVMHNNAVEIYTMALSGTVTSVVCDPNNWVINKVLGNITRDQSLGNPNFGAGLQENKAYQQISAAPNPSKGEVKVINPALAQGTIKVYDLNGKFLLEEKLKGNETLINIEKYSKGIYFLKVFDDMNNERLSQKIIKE